jgi:FAD synthetase
MKILVFGTFDILHAGHENFFGQAREFGENIIAVIARDKTVEQIKGRKAHNHENVRLKNLKKTGLATKVMLGDLKDKYKAIKKVQPDIIALGYDQHAFTMRLQKFLIDEKMKTEVVRLKPYRPEIYKSSLIRDSWLSEVQGIKSS